MIQGTAEIGIKNNEPIKVKEYFKIILNAIDRLNNVIQPLLLHLKSDKSYQFTSCNIAELINNIVVLSNANCKLKNINITFKDQNKEYLVLGDEQYIGQIFINLITNSIQAIKENGNINITISSDYFINNKQKNIKGIRIDVKDDGCGIKKEKINSLFTPYQSNNDNRNNIGLGLSIVSKIIKDHNGMITINSEIDKGTTVSTWLPLLVDDVKTETIHKDNDPFSLDDSFLNVNKFIY